MALHMAMAFALPAAISLIMCAVTSMSCSDSEAPSTSSFSALPSRSPICALVTSSTYTTTTAQPRAHQTLDSTYFHDYAMRVFFESE